MNKGFCMLMLLGLSMPSQAIDLSVGAGHQYAGVLGAQVSSQQGAVRTYGALGLIGYAIGVETTLGLSSQHTYGAVLGREEVGSEDGFIFATYNYYVSGVENAGWVFGAGLGVTRQDEGGAFGDQGVVESKTSLSLNIGYKF
jgi:hypothetical protein